MTKRTKDKWSFLIVWHFLGRAHSLHVFKGLERKCPPTPSNRLPSSSSSPSSTTKSSHLGPHHFARSPPDPSSPWRVAQVLDSPPGLPPHLSTPPSPPTLSIPAEDLHCAGNREREDQDGSASTANTLTQSIRASFNPLSCTGESSSSYASISTANAYTQVSSSRKSEHWNDPFLEKWQ